MNKMTISAILLALTAWPGLFAHAQSAAGVDARPYQANGAGVTVILCAHHAAGLRAVQPCAVGSTGEPTRLGANVTRQEIDCVLSGVCGVAERTRING